jgi:hypothetical protein
MWDYTSDKYKERKVIEKAANLTLTTLEETTLIEALKSTPEQVIEWGISKKIMPVIINNYSRLAYQIYYSLNDQPIIEKYIKY